jgi:hypothetical protein
MERFNPTQLTGMGISNMCGSGEGCVMEFDSCSKCKWWKGIVGTDDKSECLQGDPRIIWACSDTTHGYEARIRTRETTCCEFFEPEEK